MIVLDTNVVSEAIRRRPNADVLQWIDAQRPAETHLTSISVMELLYGIARLPDGRRKSRLEETLEAVIGEDFAHRILDFDVAAARCAAVVTAQREASGKPISTADGQIAAICAAHRATLATRNVKDFQGTGVALINPWAQPAT